LKILARITPDPGLPSIEVEVIPYAGCCKLSLIGFGTSGTLETTHLRAADLNALIHALIAARCYVGKAP
jgi:hypothetical protein